MLPITRPKNVTMLAWISDFEIYFFRDPDYVACTEKLKNPDVRRKVRSAAPEEEKKERGRGKRVKNEKKRKIL